MSKLRSSKRKSNTLQSDVNPEKQNSSGTKKQKKEEISRNKNGELCFPDHEDFLPNRSPKEVLQAGAFGGGYFRPIKSGVTNQSYSDVWREFPEDWFEGLKPSLHIANPTYDKLANKYKVKCGLSLQEWEASGWIISQDPYGWFQWYCRFYLGRRTDDDLRQIGRWKRFLARFKVNLINKINRSNTVFNDYTISPVIRQALLHWGYEVTQKDVEQGKNSKLSAEAKKKLDVPLI